MINAIFFDFDGVLTLDKTGSYTTCFNISKETGLELDKTLFCYRKNSSDLNLNKTTHKKIWSAFCQCVEKKVDIKILKQAFLRTPINKPMFELVKKLKKNYKLGIITNNNNERFDSLTKKLKLNKLFDSLILSANVNGLKNQKLIFEKAVESLNLKPENCIFIDNQNKNLSIPKSMGFKTILYDSEKNNILQLIKTLKKYKIKIQ